MSIGIDITNVSPLFLRIKGNDYSMATGSDVLINKGNICYITPSKLKPEVNEPVHILFTSSAISKDFKIHTYGFLDGTPESPNSFVKVKSINGKEVNSLDDIMNFFAEIL